MDRAAWLAVAAVNVLIALVGQGFSLLMLPEAGAGATARLIEAAATFQALHALAIIGLCALSWPRDNVAWLFLYGILFYSGGLYLHAAGMPAPVMVGTVIGGVLAAVGWLALAAAALSRG
jgi:uncharacterized membrane protein YgdD (TMEM256/DUF423 family)